MTISLKLPARSGCRVIGVRSVWVLLLICTLMAHTCRTFAIMGRAPLGEIGRTVGTHACAEVRIAEVFLPVCREAHLRLA